MAGRIRRECAARTAWEHEDEHDGQSHTARRRPRRSGSADDEGGEGARGRGRAAARRSRRSGHRRARAARARDPRRQARRLPLDASGVHRAADVPLRAARRARRARKGRRRAAVRPRGRGTRRVARGARAGRDRQRDLVGLRGRGEPRRVAHAPRSLPGRDVRHRAPAGPWRARLGKPRRDRHDARDLHGNEPHRADRGGTAVDARRQDARGRRPVGGRAGRAALDRHARAPCIRRRRSGARQPGRDLRRPRDRRGARGAACECARACGRRARRLARGRAPPNLARGLIGASRRGAPRPRAYGRNKGMGERRRDAPASSV
ncbi:putative uroporphyrin-III C-methyltransferase [Burkholderia pseudomallei]|nr:putative uroporphyrin-III C-methyltransferase [Burkholderia pseudomallei]